MKRIWFNKLFVFCFSDAAALRSCAPKFSLMRCGCLCGLWVIIFHSAERGEKENVKTVKVFLDVKEI
jgi:hypothetical protein